MQQRLTSRSIALTVLGAVIGAGFASGQEINHFFVRYGEGGWLAIAVSAVSFLLLMLWLTRISLKRQIDGYPKLLTVLGGKAAAGLFRHVFAAFLFIGLTVMLSGSAALLQSVFGHGKLWYSILTALLVYLVLRRQTGGVARANDLLMPCLLFLFLFYLLRSLPYAGAAATFSVASGTWVWSGLLYVAMNSAILLVVIPSLVAKAESPRDAYQGVAAASGLLLVLLLLLFHLLSKFQGWAVGADLPLLVVSQRLLPNLPWLYAIPLWIALATTALADAMGLKVYLHEHLPGREEVLFVLLLAIAAAFSQLRFASLVALLYPLTGYVCLGFYLFCLIRHLLRSLTVH